MRTVLRLLGFLRGCLKETILAVLLGSGVVAAGIGLLGTSAYLIAAAALHPSVGALQVAIVGVRFFGLSRGALRYLERLLSHSVNLRLLKKIRVWFFTQIEPLAPAGLIDARGGDLLARAVGDIDTLENFYVRAVSPPLVLLIVTLGMGWFVAGYLPAAGLILAAGLVSGGFGAAGITYIFSRRFGGRMAAARAETSLELLEGIQGMGDLIAFGQEAGALERLHAASSRLEHSQQRLGQAGAFGSLVSGLAANLTLWTVLLAVIPLVHSGKLYGISLPVLALLTLASFEAASPLSAAAQHLHNSLQSARRLFEIADTRPEVVPPEQPRALPSRLDLRIHNLSFGYGADSGLVLRNFNLDLPPGKRVGVIGPSGSGKSTLANLLMRFWDCPPQAVWLGGIDLREFDPDEVRQVIGLVPQSTYLFSGSLRQNLLLARPETTDEDLASVLKLTRLDRLASQLPGGLDAWLGSQGEQLSGGERQRVALARALLQNPAVLVLDEPTAGLDAQSGRDFIHSLRETSSGRSLLIITHDLNGLEWLDEILVLVDGRVVERGAPAELARTGGWYARGLELRRQVLEDGEL